MYHCLYILSLQQLFSLKDMFPVVHKGVFVCYCYLSGAWTPVALLSACVVVLSSGSHSRSRPRNSEIRSLQCKYLLLTEILVVHTGRHSCSFFTQYHRLTALKLNFLIWFCLCQSVCLCDQVLCYYDINNKLDFLRRISHMLWHSLIMCYFGEDALNWSVMVKMFKRSLFEISAVLLSFIFFKDSWKK